MKGEVTLIYWKGRPVEQVRQVVDANPYSIEFKTTTGKVFRVLLTADTDVLEISVDGTLCITPVGPNTILVDMAELKAYDSEKKY